MGTIDRRAFGAALVTGGVAAGGVAGAEEPEAKDKPGATAPPLAEVPEVDLLLELALREVPKEHRTPEVVAEIRLDIERNLNLGKTVGRFPLENGDSPAPPFRAWRAE